MTRINGSLARRALAGLGLCAAVAVPLLAPGEAHAWWRAGVVVGGPVFVPPPVVYAPPPVYYAPPPVAYAPPPAYYYVPRPLHWVPGHYDWRGFWHPGHWA